MDLLNRKWTLIALVLITPLGFYTKFYAGPASAWVNNYLGGVLYVIFWSLLLFLVIPKPDPLKISSVVLVVTCALEFLQLWKPPFLQFLRSYFIGRTILGTSFVWWDLGYYVVGFVCSLLLLTFLVKHDLKVNTEHSG